MRRYADCAAGRHLFVVTYERPWRRLWRRRYVLRCWDCPLRMTEP